MPDYQFDIFISYKRDSWGVFDEWLSVHFIPLFMMNIGNSIAAVCHRRRNDIFYDRAKLDEQQRKLEGIEPGEDWRNALSKAIKESRCVLALWSPEYFYSEWCQIEWRSFHSRNSNLVIPISVHDGSSFPGEAARLQFEDFSDYVILGEAFKSSHLYVPFQIKVRELTHRIAKVVNDAPPFQDWQVVNSPENLLVESATSIPQKKL